MVTAVKYRINNLNCANCAAKIERRATEIAGIKSASIDLPRGIIHVETDGSIEQEAAVRELSRLAGSIETGVTVTSGGSAVKKAASDIACDCDGHEHHGHHDHHDHAHDHAHDHSHGHEHSHSAPKGSARYIIWLRLAAAILAVVAIIAIDMPDWLRYVIAIAAWLVAGADILVKTIKNISHGEIFDENLLMTIATIGALCIGELPEAVGVMVFYQIGEFFQGLAVEKSRKSISDMLDLQPTTANLYIDGTYKTVPVESIVPGDIIALRAGERVPIDCTVLEGSAAFDTSSLTGESVPRDAAKGDSLLSGFMNLNGQITARADKAARDSAAAKITEFLDETSANKAPAEAFITKFARYYTPIVVLLAVLVAVVPPLFVGSFGEWLYRALVFLVVSCPCALVLSVPLSFFGGIGGASKKGILVKGGSYLEALAKADTIVFDKTGTLTKGEFRVSEISPAPGIAEQDLLSTAATAEQGSSHPIALSILKHYSGDIAKAEISELAGFGVRARAGDTIILAGNASLMADNGITGVNDAGGTAVHVARDGEYMGYILIEDTVKDDSKKAIDELKKLGIENIVMLTGDSRTAAEKIADSLGISDVKSRLLPVDKTTEIDRIMAAKGSGSTVAFVGDGLNDAPALAAADVGIAMAAAGNQIAAEAADMVIVSGSPYAVCQAVKVSRKTRKIVRQNVVFALIVKVAVLALAAAGLVPMWGAVFADVGVALLAVLNAIRSLNVK